MPRRPDIDAAVEHLDRYAGRDEWTAHRREHLATMLGRIPDDFGLDLEGLFEEVRRLGHLSSLAGFLDESFLASEHGAGRVNVIDDYLRRRGWQETPRAREYLQAIRTTPPALYEVWDVAFGEWIEVRDRLRDEPPRRIVEHSGSQTLQRWDCFVARVVHPRDELMLTGGVLSLTRNTADDIEKLLRRAARRGEKNPVDRLLFQGWLKGLLEAGRRPLPTLSNTDGDPLLPSTTRLPIADGAAMEIERRMDALAGWERDEIEVRQWTWKKQPTDATGTVLGSARLTTDALVIDTNSRERMDRALAMLRPALAALVGAGLTSHEDVVHALRQPPSSRTSTRARAPEPAPALDATAMAGIASRKRITAARSTSPCPCSAIARRANAHAASRAARSLRTGSRRSRTAN